MIEAIRAELEKERASESYQKKQKAAARRREQKQKEYIEQFRQAVLDYLRFAATYEEVARQLAEAVTQHATPVGSGTVARTERIPIEKRAEAAVIAWLRHQTTGYENLKIPRVKGKRREARRMIAQQSLALLQRYRDGLPVEANCPLQQALKEEG